MTTPRSARSSSASRRRRGARARPGSTGSSCTACNGYLFTQFLSPAINDREDEYGGSLREPRALPLDIVRAIRREVGDDFHVQFKINGVDHNDALFPWGGKGNDLRGLDPDLRGGSRTRAWTRSTSRPAASFPHPRNPAGDFPLEDTVRDYDTMLSSGANVPELPRVPHAGRSTLFMWAWERSAKATGSRGSTSTEARAVKQAVSSR